MTRHPSAASDRALATQVLEESDERAFRTLYWRHTPYLYQLVLRTLAGRLGFGAIAIRSREREESVMKATAEIQVVPIGSGVSVRREVQRAHEIIKQSGLEVALHAYGTNVEGELSEILDAVRRVHEILHAEGTVRLSTNLKIGTRTDKEPTLAGKLF